MMAISLQSGSNGNCTYVESKNIKLLFDAGISGIAAERRLAACGLDIRDMNALIVSHDHADHVRYAGVYQRKYGIPVYISPKTLQSAEKTTGLGCASNINIFSPGDTLHFGDLFVRTLPTPHDCVDGAVFIICSGTKRLGIMTDLGHVFEEIRREICTLDGVFIESNYDTVMLRNGAYPAFLKRRIEGPGGHLSNRESAELLREGKRLKWACLSHLSENNNDPDVALRTHRHIAGHTLTLYTASRSSASGILRI